MPFAARIGLLFVFVCSCAQADTIVLKNGRRIVADGVTDDGEHIAYQTPAGEMSLPLSVKCTVPVNPAGMAAPGAVIEIVAVYVMV